MSPNMMPNAMIRPAEVALLKFLFTKVSLKLVCLILNKCMGKLNTVYKHHISYI